MSARGKTGSERDGRALAFPGLVAGGNPCVVGKPTLSLIITYQTRDIGRFLTAYVTDVTAHNIEYKYFDYTLQYCCSTAHWVRCV